MCIFRFLLAYATAHEDLEVPPTSGEAYPTPAEAPPPIESKPEGYAAPQNSYSTSNGGGGGDGGGGGAEVSAGGGEYQSPTNSGEHNAPESYTAADSQEPTANGGDIGGGDIGGGGDNGGGVGGDGGDGGGGDEPEHVAAATESYHEASEMLHAAAAADVEQLATEAAPLDNSSEAAAATATSGSLIETSSSEYKRQKRGNFTMRILPLV